MTKLEMIPDVDHMDIGARQENLAVQGEDPSFAPLWLPGQDVAGSNHTPVWVPRSSGS